jgi:hypothetical protein
VRAKTAKRLHWLGVFFWSVQMIAVGFVMWPPGWKMYLVEISLAANVIGHASGVSAERPTEIEE